jgi:hypothetical protein
MVIERVTLKDWINSEGLYEVARKLKVNRVTVDYWRKGIGLPKPQIMREIVKLTDGKVSYEEMIETYFARRSNHNKHSKKK